MGQGRPVLLLDKHFKEHAISMLGGEVLVKIMRASEYEYLLSISIQNSSS
jgi:hypothetical protein